MSLYLEFDKLVHALTAAKVPFAVAGGLAVGLHGFVRTTKDIDILVQPIHIEKVREIILGLGYRENPGTLHFPNSGLGLRRYYRRLPAQEELLIIDVLLSESPSMTAVLRRARSMRYRSLRIRVVSVTDLIQMKRQRGSKLDEADIEKLQQLPASAKRKPHHARRARDSRD